MKSDNPTLKQLFEGEKEYRVPLYQRLYVWNEADQWAPLWEDITGIAAKLAETEKVTPHFFGAIVLKIGGITPEESSVWRVIDGQQRLTTMQLVIAAVADEFDSRREDSKAAARLRELIENPRHAWPERRYKMRHSGNNYALFADVMGADGDEEVIHQLDNTVAGGQPNSAMAECYLYFRNAARRWLQSATDDNAAERLTDTLRTKLQTVAIYLEPDEPEHLIFETLNARGAALTEWDKIRNYLFYRIQEDQDGLFRKLSDFDEDWWREESGKGQDRRPRTDRFVDYWLESKIEVSVGASRVFREFRERAESLDREGLCSWIESLADDAKHYLEFESGIEHPNQDSVERLFHERRRWMEIGSIWPFLLGLRRADLDRNRYHSVLSTLESWWVRRWIRGCRGHSYPDRALDLLRRVSKTKGGPEVPGVVLDRLAELADAGGRWPGDVEVKTAVVENFHSLRLRRLILEAVERHLTPPRAEKDPPKHGVLQIEHIMPVAWKPDAWPIGKDTPEAREEREGWIETLGNLTLVHEKLNPGMGNNAWEKKQKAIFENSTLFLNKDLLRRAPDTWDEDAIRRRGEWLAEQVCEIWPHAEVLRQRLGEP